MQIKGVQSYMKPVGATIGRPRKNERITAYKTATGRGWYLDVLKNERVFVCKFQPVGESLGAPEKQTHTVHEKRAKCESLLRKNINFDNFKKMCYNICKPT